MTVKYRKNSLILRQEASKTCPQALNSLTAIAYSGVWQCRTTNKIKIFSDPMGKLLSDFKEFAMRGNVIDMAVGVIIGGAFGKIVSSLVNDVIMPVVGILTGGIDFKESKVLLKAAEMNGEEIVKPEVWLTWGMFIQNVVDFLIIAFCIFMAIRIMNRFKKKEEEKPAAPAGPTQEELLTEIRDLLKQQNQK